MHRENANLRYSLQFLRNAGERVRAVCLAKDCLGISLREARDFVDGLKDRVELSSNRTKQKLCAECNVLWKEETVECPICKGKELVTKYANER